MQQIAEIDPELIEKLATEGCRFTHHSSITPTGTISLSLANNASNGIEPSFAHHYSRNVIREGKKSKEHPAAMATTIPNAPSFKIWPRLRSSCTLEPCFFFAMSEVVAVMN